MITTIVQALAAERTEGNEHAEQLVARIDSHIRDLETLKAWIMDSARLRAEAIDSLIGGSVPPEAPKPAIRDRSEAAE